MKPLSDEKELLKGLANNDRKAVEPPAEVLEEKKEEVAPVTEVTSSLDSNTEEVDKW